MPQQNTGKAIKLFKYRIFTFSISLLLIISFFGFTYYTLNTGYAVHHIHMFFLGFSILVIGAIATSIETIIITRTSVSLYSGKEFTSLEPQQVSAIIQKLRDLKNK